MREEQKVSSSSYFVTLTYDTRKVPITKNGYMSLSIPDVQKFMKRLRHYQDSKIKYYLCGEYGELKSRPHYHAIMFNLENITAVNEAWNMGATHFGSVTNKSIAYTVKYLDKKRRKRRHSREDYLDEFSLMSKGIGKSYLTSRMIKWHKENMFGFYYKNGKKMPLPRYYRDRIFDDREKLLLRLQYLEEQKKKEERDKVYLKYNYGDSMTLEQLQHVRKLNRHIKYFKTLKFRDNG